MISLPARSLQTAALLALLAMPVAAGREPAIDVQVAKDVEAQNQRQADQQRAMVLKANAAGIEQQAKQHWEPHLQIVLATHLDNVKRICPNLSPEARRAIAAAGKNAVQAAARQIAEMQFGARPQQPGTAIASISTAVGAALEPFASPEALATYTDVEAERRGRLDRAAQQVTLVILDDRLMLSATQRDAIAADLQKQWQPGWSNVINGQVINNQIVAPDCADKSIAPHLDNRQRAEWKSWCEQAGGTRFGMHNAPVWPGQHGVDISGLKADPWWTP